MMTNEEKRSEASLQFEDTFVAAQSEEKREATRHVLDLLRTFPDNGRPDNPYCLEADLMGLIERHTQFTRCGGCGHKKESYSYWKPTELGRIIRRALLS